MSESRLASDAACQNPPLIWNYLASQSLVFLEKMVAFTEGNSIPLCSFWEITERNLIKMFLPEVSGKISRNQKNVREPSALGRCLSKPPSHLDFFGVSESRVF